MRRTLVVPEGDIPPAELRWSQGMSCEWVTACLWLHFLAGLVVCDGKRRADCLVPSQSPELTFRPDWPHVPPFQEFGQTESIFPSTITSKRREGKLARSQVTCQRFATEFWIYFPPLLQRSCGAFGAHVLPDLLHQRDFAADYCNIFHCQILLHLSL